MLKINDKKRLPYLMIKKVLAIFSPFPCENVVATLASLFNGDIKPSEIFKVDSETLYFRKLKGFLLLHTNILLLFHVSSISVNG